MSGTTSPDGLTYPSLTDAPNGPAAIQSLANSIQTAINLRARLRAVNGGLSGSTWDGSTSVQMQAGTSVVTTNGGGGATVTFPVAFPNGLIAFIPVPGDGLMTSPPSNIFSQGNVAYQGIITNVASATVRITWIALGW